MLEWLKRHAWKACIPQKGIPSSNLGHSAKKKSRKQYCLRDFFIVPTKKGAHSKNIACDGGETEEQKDKGRTGLFY